jgi:putative ABC transport system permease protein
LNRSLRKNRVVFKQELLRHTQITGVTYSCCVPGENMWLWSPSINGVKKSIHVNAVDPDFFETYSIRMAGGRNFEWENHPDQDNKFIVNEAAVKFFEIEAPLSQIIESVPNGRGRGEIIGVVRDFHFNSMSQKIGPMIFYWLNWPHQKVSVRLSLDPGNGAGRQIRRILGYIHKQWNTVCPEYPFEYAFLDDVFDRQYRDEQRLSEIFLIFSLLVIFITVIGLFGLSSFETEQRTKEIGIRKVLGATVSSIIFQFSRKFTKLVLWSCLIASPLAWLVANNWLQGFAYRTRVDWMIFVGSAAICIFVTLGTVGFQALKAAHSDPVDTLRYE